MLQEIIDSISADIVKVKRLLEADPCEQYERAINNLDRAVEYLEDKKPSKG